MRPSPQKSSPQISERSLHRGSSDALTRVAVLPSNRSSSRPRGYQLPPASRPSSLADRGPSRRSGSRREAQADRGARASRSVSTHGAARTSGRHCAVVDQHCLSRSDSCARACAATRSCPYIDHRQTTSGELAAPLSMYPHARRGAASVCPQRPPHPATNSRTRRHPPSLARRTSSGSGVHARTTVTCTSARARA